MLQQILICSRYVLNFTQNVTQYKRIESNYDNFLFRLVIIFIYKGSSLDSRLFDILGESITGDHNLAVSEWVSFINATLK